MSATAPRGRRYKLWSSSVYKLQPAKGAGAKGADAVTAFVTLEESASLFGVDGRQADAYQSVYDTEYRIVKCEDGAWRIAEAKVIGKEPGAAPQAAR